MTHPLVVDASAVIAHFLAGDAHQPAASAELSRAGSSGRRVIIHPITLAECLVGAARLGTTAARQAEIAAVGIRTTTIDDDAPRRLAHLRAASGLRMPDCCVIDAAEHSNADVLSFDDRLRAAAHARGITVVPEVIAQV